MEPGSQQGRHNAPGNKVTDVLSETGISSRARVAGSMESQDGSRSSVNAGPGAPGLVFHLHSVPVLFKSGNWVV